MSIQSVEKDHPKAQDAAHLITPPSIVAVVVTIISVISIPVTTTVGMVVLLMVLTVIPLAILPIYRWTAVIGE